MKKAVLTILAVVLLAVSCFGIYKYIDYRQYYAEHFNLNTTINGVDCSNMTVKEAKKALTKEWNSKSFKIEEHGEEIATLTHLKFKYDISDSLSELMKESSHFPVLARLAGHKFDLTMPMKVKKNTRSFNRQVKALPIFDDTGKVKTENAYVDLSTRKFRVVPEVYGTNVDKKTVKDKIKKLIANGTWTLEYREKDFYEQPTITSDSQEIKDQLEYCKQYLSAIITYDFGKTKYTLTPEQIDKMLKVKDNGEVKTRSKKVDSFVYDMALKYNTVGATRSFKSSARGTVQVYGGTYGYMIDLDKEAKQLKKDLKSLKNVEREPIYAQKGVSRIGSDIGNTYIEVDLACQNLWYYKDGKCVLESPIVSGCVSNNTTTVTGTFSIAYLERNATLRGQNVDGKDYESKVHYWMPFYNGYGLHDADWRSAFGGSIYLSSGSHGCVNMPDSEAAALFNSIFAGCPVVVFN